MLAGILAAVASLLFGHARGAKQERTRQAAETEKRNRQMATKLRAVDATHRQEQTQTKADLSDGKRDQMEDKW